MRAHWRVAGLVAGLTIATVLAVPSAADYTTTTKTYIVPSRHGRFFALAPARRKRLAAGRLPRARGDTDMRELHNEELKFVSGGSSKNQGGGPGNSGPGDKNSQNEKGHGGQPTG